MSKKEGGFLDCIYGTVVAVSVGDVPVLELPMVITTVNVSPKNVPLSSVIRQAPVIAPVWSVGAAILTEKVLDFG